MPTSSRYHPGRRDGGGGQGTAVPSPKRDANRQSWEKVNKGHAPCRRPAGAHPPLRPQPVHFHSPGASPPPDSRAAPRGGGPPPTPAPAPYAGAAHPAHSPGKGVPRPSKTLCLICAEPPRPRAEHAAPACSARVHPAQRGGDRAEAVAPGRCLGPDPLHVSPARSHVHRLSPVRRPDVLRINKMKLRATGGQIAPGPPNPSPRQNDPPHHCCLPPQPLRAAGARGASCSPGAPPPARAPSPARGRFAAVINKEGRQAHPSKSCCCMRPSQPPRNVLFKTGLTNMRNLSPLCCASPPLRALAS